MDLALASLKRIFESVFITVAGANCDTPTFEYQQLAYSSRRALAERVEVSVTLGYKRVSEVRVREKQFPARLGNRLKKKSEAFNEVQVTDVQVERVEYNVAVTQASAVTLPGLFQFGGLVFWVIIAASLVVVVIILAIGVVAVCCCRCKGEQEDAVERYEVAPVSKLDPNSVADAVLEEVTSGIDFTPKPRPEDPPSEIVEVPDTSEFNATTFAGAQDLVNNIIKGVLDPDPDASPVTQGVLNDKHDEAVLMHIAMQEISTPAFGDQSPRSPTSPSGDPIERFQEDAYESPKP